MSKIENVIIVDGKEYITAPKSNGGRDTEISILNGLKPCPFCGGKAELKLTGITALQDRFSDAPRMRIFCRKCGKGSEVPDMLNYCEDIRLVDTEVIRRVMESWNTRVRLEEV